MSLMSRFRIAIWTIASSLLLVSYTQAARIDAKRGRIYKITKQHGPWMIMVATFHKPPPDRRGKGLSPMQAANELVYELRKVGIPAYPFTTKGAYTKVGSRDRVGRQRRSFTAFHGGVTVLAGNYSSPKSKLAQDTLAYIKKFHPKFLSDVSAKDKKFRKTRSGGLFRVTPGRPGPLSGAHLTPNPLLSPEELKNNSYDPLVVKLNSGSDISLLKNPGKYSLVVATFTGKSMTALNSRRFQKKFELFKVGNSLDEAGQQAWELAMALRKLWNIEAWVYHDRHSSMVTVGSFNTDSDPRIKSTAFRFQAKQRQHPQSGRKILTAEILTIPKKPKPGEKIQKHWIFDPTPRLISVPKIAK
ncbi:MAG: hypothetical protein Tsb009_06360 [Planctomycetaceae bacterium]